MDTVGVLLRGLKQIHIPDDVEALPVVGGPSIRQLEIHGTLNQFYKVGPIAVCMVEGNLDREALVGADYRFALILHGSGDSAEVIDIKGEAAPLPESSGIALHMGKGFFLIVAGAVPKGEGNAVGFQKTGDLCQYPVSELCAGIGYKDMQMPIDTDLTNPVADILLPVFGDPGGAAYDAQNGANSTGGAVTVITAVNGVNNGFFEIAFAVNEADGHKAQIQRSLEPAQIPCSFHQHIPGVPVGGLFVVLSKDQPDTLGYPAALRDIGQSGLHDLADICFCEGDALQCSGEDLCVNTLTHTVIDGGIHNGVLDSHIGETGSKAGPNLRTDPCAVGVLPLVVFKFTGQGRQQTQRQVLLTNAVFVPGGRDHQLPALCQSIGIKVLGTQAFQGNQPCDLQVQVVVGQRLSLGRGVAGNIVHCPLAFKGSAHGSADVLADPASKDLVTQGIVIVNCLFHIGNSLS